MIFNLIAFFILLTFLLFLSGKIISNIYLFNYLFNQSKRFSLWVIILLFLPGTLIHELSHFLVASLLRVATGRLSIFPTTNENGQIQAGHLQLAKVDPFRLSLIGIAPMIVGLIIIYSLSKFFLSSFSPSGIYNLSFYFAQDRQFAAISLFLLFVYCYLLFVISTTMFSSKKDLEGLIVVVPITFVLIFSLYWLGIRIVLAKDLLQKIDLTLSQLNFYLFIACLTDITIYAFLSLNLYLWQRILRKKIQFKKKVSGV